MPGIKNKSATFNFELPTIATAVDSPVVVSEWKEAINANCKVGKLKLPINMVTWRDLKI